MNFLEDSQAASLVAGCRSAREAIEALTLLSGVEAIPGRTLLFLDEVQEVPIS